LKLISKFMIFAIIGTFLLACQLSATPPKSPLSSSPEAEINESVATSSPVEKPEAYGEDRLILTTASRSLESVESTDQFFRLIEGLDEEPIIMSEDEVAQQLNDPWATYVLRRGMFPTSLEEILATIDAQGVFTMKDEPGPDFSRASFVVGEGSQIVSDSGLDRDYRLIVVWQFVGDGNTFLTLPAGDHLGLHELISWDANKQAFNFYRRVDDPSRWIWRGDTRHAFDDQARGQGCFACHPNGSLLMKELQRPWLNWESEEAGIPPDAVPDQVRPADRPDLRMLFDNRSPAQVLEETVRGGVRSTNRARVLDVNNDGESEHVPSLFRQLLSADNANLISSRIKPSTAEPESFLSVPFSFFINVSGLTRVAGLEVVPINSAISWQAYTEALERYEFALEKGDFRQAGGTHFAFVVPEPAAEDVDLMSQMRRRQWISQKFAASVLMVDFPNPVYSDVRNELLAYLDTLPETVVYDERGDVMEQLATSILDQAEEDGACAGEELGQCTAEQQFAFYWQLADDEWQQVCQDHIETYLLAVSEQLATDEGVDDYIRLSISRRQQFTTRAPSAEQAESALLFPVTNLDNQKPLRMNRDGSVN